EGHTIRQREVLVPLARPGDGVIEDRYFSYTQQPRYDQQGQINGVFVFAVEVTDQVQARQQVQDLNEKLAAINEELTAPITNIESIVLALRDTLPADVQQEEMIAHLLDLLEQTTARFKLTIGQLTDLSKLQLAHAGPAEPVPLAAVIEAVRLDLAPALTAAAAQLTVEQRGQVPRPGPAGPGAGARLFGGAAGGAGSAGQRAGAERAPAEPPVRPLPTPAHPRRRHGRGALHYQAAGGERRRHHCRGEPCRRGHHLHPHLSRLSAFFDAALIQRSVLLGQTCLGPDSAACPQLLFLDMNMPVLNGLGFLEAYAQLPLAQQSSIVIVMLTTSLHPVDQARAEQLPIAGFLNKPLTK
nr:hypothetical protein [Tanacetum cinerariifolium]